MTITEYRKIFEEELTKYNVRIENNILIDNDDEKMYGMVSDVMLQSAMENGFSPENFAWALVQ